MSSKKKPRPLFEVPVEIGSGQGSGWVYRSAPHAPEAPNVAIPSAADRGARSTSTNAVSLAMAALAQTFVLGLTIAAIPLTMGLAALQSLGRPAVHPTVTQPRP